MIRFTIAALALIAAPAFAQVPTERKPNGDFENAYPRWHPYVVPQAYLENNTFANYLQGMSVAVDSGNVTHIAAVEVLTTPQGEVYSILYFNDRVDGRRSNGWSVSPSPKLSPVKPGK